jgi:flagellar P-ring protein precursor FlgI
VRISKVAVSHGDIKVSIRNEVAASQPVFIGNAGDGVRTALVTNTRVDVDEQNAGAGFIAGATTVSDLVQSLARMKTPTRDIIRSCGPSRPPALCTPN